MADVSCSVPPSKKLSGVGEVSSKHIYDDVFSAPPARKPNAFRVDDYREIFSPSNASLGDSIPILDLPAVDRSDDARSGFDYAGVFAGRGDDNRIGVPAEEMFRNSKKKAKRDLHPPRPSMRTNMPASKSQEFPRNSGNNQALKIPTQTRVIAKSQEFYGGSENFQTSTSALPHQQFDGVDNFGVSHHKTSQLCNDMTDGTTHIAHLNAVPGYTQLVDEVGSAMETEVQKTKQMSMDDVDIIMDVGKEKRQGKHTRAVSDLAPDKQAAGHDAKPQRESCVDECYVPDVQKTKQMSMDEVDISMDVGKKKGQGKHTRAVSDLAPDKQAADLDAKPQRESRVEDCYIPDASHCKEEADSKPQAYSVSTPSGPNQSFGGNDYFQRSTCHRPRRSRSNRQSGAAPDSSPSLLEEELDVSSSAAVSAAAMKRALEEAEAKIRCAKELLKGQEGNRSIKATFKDSFKVKTRVDTDLAYEACLLKQNGNSNIQTMRQHISADEDAALEQKDGLNVKATNGKEDCTETGGLKLKDGLDISSTTIDQLADEAGGLEVKLEGVAAEVDSTRKCIGLSTCALETFENSNPVHQPEFVSVKQSEDKTGSYEVLESAEKSCKQESGGEWEATKHLSLLISGVKSRLVSFMSKQADTEKTVGKEDKPSTGGYWDLFEGGAYQVHDADPHMKNAAYQDHLEKEVKENHDASSGVEESARDFNRRGMEILEPEESEANRAVPLEQRRFGGVEVSPVVEIPILKECGPSEPEEKSEKIQLREFTQVKGKHIQGDVQDQCQKISDGSVGWDYEESQMDAIELEESDATPEATYKARGYDSEGDKIREDKQDVGKVMRDQENVDKDLKNPFVSEGGNWRQDEFCSRGEMEESISPEKKPENVESECMQNGVQDQSKMNLDDSVGWKYEEGQISHSGQEHERNSKATYQSEGCDSQEDVDCKVKNAAANEVQVQGPVEKEVNGSIKDENEKWKVEGGTEKKLEEIEMVEETCTEESQEREQAGESCEDNKMFEVDAKSEATVSGHDERLAPADNLCEHDQYLFMRKNEEACRHDDLSRFAQHTDFNFEDKREMEQLAATTFEPKVVAEQPISLQMANQLIEEDAHEQAQCSTEVADDISDHDDFFPATDDISEQEEMSSLSGDEEASGRDYCQDADFIFDEEQMAESTSTNSETKVMPQQPCSVHAKLDENEACEQHGSSTEGADVTLDHGERPPETTCNEDHETHEHHNGDQDVKSTFEDEKKCESIAETSQTKLNDVMQTANELTEEEMCVESGSSTEVADETTYLDERSSSAMCKKEESSCSNKIEERFGESDRYQFVQDVKFPLEDERMPESNADASDSELIAEQSSFVQTSTDYIEEDMIETSTSDGDSGDFDTTEEETEGAPEVLSYANVLKTEHQNGLEFERKLGDQGKFTVDTGPENQGNESEVRIDTSKVEVASDQDNRAHSADTSSKRKRWFENGEEVLEFARSGIPLGDERTLQQDVENAVESTVDDVSGIRVGETVHESGDSTNVRQTDAGSGLEDLHNPDATQRRRRWFENRGEELPPHKSSLFEGAGVSIQLEDEIAQEPEHDDGLRNCAEKLLNDGEEGTVLGGRVASDHVESTASAEAARRRRRWFENADKIRPAQKPTILEDNGVNANQEEEIEIGVDTTRHDELGEKTTASVTANEQKIQRKKEREKRRERIAVERVIREARERAFAEARERATGEARQKATTASQDRQGKVPSEVKPGPDKAMDAKIKAERAAVERATEEARERALQKAMSEKSAYRPREKDLKKQNSVPSSGPGNSSAPSVPEKSSGAVGESPRRRKAISERNRRTMERSARALEEKNMRDSIAQKEQAERNRYADALDAELKRWLAGKEGNLRSLLSTLQYILGPESGWQAIPLTDLVTSTAIRKAYKRAALCVHPDKLQQRGATIQQKYICEKVFDLLKDAWQKFNPDD